MQINTIKPDFVFSHVYLYCKNYLKIADFGHFRQLFFGKKNYLEKYFRTTLQKLIPLYVGTNQSTFRPTNAFSSRDNFFSKPGNFEPAGNSRYAAERIKTGKIENLI